MKALLIHVSDIHFKSGKNIATDRMPAISKAVANVEVDLGAAIIVISGDVAFSGKPEQYKIAKDAIVNLKCELESRMRNVPVSIIAVPGNHDCDYENEKSARGIIIESLTKDPARNYDADIFEQCTLVQTHFFQFLDTIQTTERIHTMSRAYYEYEFPVGNGSILFRCYNTALCSVLKEKQGSLSIPNSLLDKVADQKQHSYVASVFHHPYNWLSQLNARTFRKHIEATSDLILTGHEHESDNFAKYNRMGESTLYLEGPAFQESDSEEYSGFNAVWIDFATQQEKTATFSWNESLFETTEASLKWQPFRRSRRLIAKEFQITAEMEHELDDLGAKFTHPTKENVTLSDIFVFPDAKAVILDEKNKPLKEEHIESRDLLKFISNKRRLLITGREHAGKTALAKIIFRDYYEKGFVPVLLKGEQVNFVELDKFESLVQRQLVNQYQNPKLPAFNQLDRDQTVIIIDDFDDVTLAAKGRHKLLSNIHKRFERVIIFSDTTVWLEEVADGRFAASILVEYSQITIKDFGFFLRSKLIEKWCRLGAEYSLTEQDLQCKITRYEGLIDNALQRNYLPAIPFFILIYIQSLDAAQPVSTSAGSYGHLCELLISMNLATAHKVATLNTKKTYLAELAYSMFDRNVSEFSQDEFQLFHDRHCVKYNLHLDRESLLQELIDSSVLTRADGGCSFKYAYYKHYFIALFMRDGLDNPSVMERVKALSKKLHKADNANIWLFLSHHSKNPLLVDLILEHAKSLFAEAHIPNFDNDISFFKTVSDLIPSVVLVNRSPSELREERRRQLDTAPQDQEIPDEDYEKSEFARFLAEITDALRTLDVMGQIAKNFSGSLVGPVKFQLINECYRLGLRVVGLILDVWKDEPEKAVNDLVDIILNAIEKDEKFKNVTRQELMERVKSLFFYFTEFLSFEMVKRISHSVGAVELIPTFRDILSANPTNAYKLVDISVKLDALKFPGKEVVALNGDFKTNVLCGRLLKRLVVHHLYLFPSDYKTKQRICEELKIPVQELRGIDAATEKQKTVSLKK